MTVDAGRGALCLAVHARASVGAETEMVFHRELSKLTGDIQAVALRQLRMLSNAHAINDLRSPPANRLE